MENKKEYEYCSTCGQENTIFIDAEDKKYIFCENSNCPDYNLGVEIEEKIS